jgi:cob(I)alamin adenosyltransferase
MIINYYGSGKGKTTAAIGLAVRALLRGKKVAYMQFSKTKTNAISKFQNKFNLNPQNFHFESFGIEGFFDPTSPPKEFIEIIQDGWQQVKSILSENKYDIIILDELNYVSNFLNLQEIVETIKFFALPSKFPTIVITGRQAPKQLLDCADLITEMKEIKHPFQKGIKAICGIDF